MKNDSAVLSCIKKQDKKANLKNYVTLEHQESRNFCSFFNHRGWDSTLAMLTRFPRDFPRGFGGWVGVPMAGSMVN